MDLGAFSFKAQCQIEQVRTQAERAFLMVVREPEPIVRPDADGGYTLHGADGAAYGFPSREHRLEAATISYVLRVLEAITAALCVDEIRSVTEIRTVVDQAWGELLTDAYRDKHPRHVPADLFITRAARARLEQSWWLEFQDALNSRPLRTFGHQLRVLLNEARWNIATLVEKTKFAWTTVEDHLSDAVTPRGGTVATYERVFTEELGHPVKFAIASPDSSTTHRPKTVQNRTNT